MPFFSESILSGSIVVTGVVINSFSLDITVVIPPVIRKQSELIVVLDFIMVLPSVDLSKLHISHVSVTTESKFLESL